MLEYAPKGLVGVLTPQANTTVEAEFSILKPPSFGIITARLTSKKTTINARLIDYINHIDNCLDVFANAPLKAAIFACTGASYFFENHEEKIYFEKISASRGYPIISATNAINEALDVIKPRTIGIISPYDDDLHDKAMSYWKKIPYKIKVIKRLKQNKKNFHPIYTIKSKSIENSLHEINSENCELILFLGTGLSTLPTIFKCNKNLIVISANLCLLWRAHLIIENKKPSNENLKQWYNGNKWKNRFLNHL